MTSAQDKGLFIAGIVAASALMGLWLAGTWPALVLASQESSAFSSNVLGEYVSGIVWALCLTLVVAVWGSQARFRGPLLVVWLAKAFICLGPMLFYDFTYGVDVDGYFGNARLYGWDRFEVGGGKQTIYNIAAFNIRFLSDSYFATRLTFAFIGLVGVYLIYRAGVMLLDREDKRLFYALALLPSILFWSSILGKEPIALFGISAFVYGVVRWQKRGGWGGILWAAAGLVVAVYVRVWLGPILVAPLTVIGWQRAAGFWRRAAFLGLGIAGVLLAPTVLRDATGIDIAQREELLEQTNTLSRSFDRGGSTQEAPELITPGNVLMFAPFGIFTVLFRPLPGEVPNVFGSLAGIDSVLLLLLACRAMRRTRLKDLREPLVLWALLTLIIWAMVYAVDSFQNLGTASRHRLEITPFMLGLILYLGRSRASVAAAVPARPAVRRRMLANRQVHAS